MFSSVLALGGLNHLVRRGSPMLSLSHNAMLQININLAEDVGGEREVDRPHDLIHWILLGTAVSIPPLDR